MDLVWLWHCTCSHRASAACSHRNPDVVAAACGDNLVRVWHTDHRRTHHVRTVWRGIQCRVLSVCWHPTAEDVVAYGLDDGTVGVHDVARDRQHTSSFRHARAVQCVRWACVPDAIPVLLALSADGAWVVHDNPKIGTGTNAHAAVAEWTRAPPAVASAMSSTRVCVFAVHDGSTSSHDAPVLVAFACGTDVVHVTTLSPAGHGGCSTACHSSNVAALAWRSVEGALVDTLQAQQPVACLAAGCDDGKVYVVDVSRAVHGRGDAENTASLSTPRALPRPHSAAVTCVAWSHADEHLLVSTSADGTARVWDTTAMTPVAHFAAHVGKVCAWQRCEWQQCE